MQDHHSLADEKTVEHPPDPGATPRPKLEKPITHCPRMRKAKVRPVIDQEFNQASIIRKDVDRPGFDLGQDALVEILDPVAHDHMLANVLTRRNWLQVRIIINWG